MGHGEACFLSERNPQKGMGWHAFIQWETTTNLMELEWKDETWVLCIKALSLVVQLAWDH